MPEILLTNGGIATVDAADFEALSCHKWQRSPQGYAYRCSSRSGKRQTILMHRVIAQTPAGFVTDHINQNTLDNRRLNLRTSTKGLNAINSKPNRANSSGYRNVTRRRDTGKWQAGVCRDGKYINLGSWATPELANAAVQRFKTRGRGVKAMSRDREFEERRK